MIELNKEIRRSVDTGKVLFGAKSTEKSLLSGKVQMVIISSNAEKQTKERLNYYADLNKIKSIEFIGNGLELGNICGRPFNVSCLAILDAGKSKLDEFEVAKRR